MLALVSLSLFSRMSEREPIPYLFGSVFRGVFVFSGLYFELLIGLFELTVFDAFISTFFFICELSMLACEYLRVAIVWQPCSIVEMFFVIIYTFL